MTQLSLKVGLKCWGEKAKDAACSEMKQLLMRNTFEPLLWKNLDDDQKKTVLESHMFLTEKRDGKIKGRTVAGGNKQRDFISKEVASSPTVAADHSSRSCPKPILRGSRGARTSPVTKRVRFSLPHIFSAPLSRFHT
jgi:hypothetical protein